MVKEEAMSRNADINLSRSQAVDLPLWLHFLPVDVRRACGLSKRLERRDQFAILRWVTLVAAVVVKEFCLINPGSVEESEMNTALLADLFPLIDSGLIRFSMRERDFLDLREKKRREYRYTHDSYGSFASYDLYKMLNKVARVYPRRISVGDTIANVLGDEQFYKEAVSDFAPSDLDAAAEQFPEAANRIRHDQLALTWPQIQQAIDSSTLSAGVGLDLVLRAYFDANRLGGEYAVFFNLPFFEHAERLVLGVSSVDFCRITSAFRKYEILKEMTEISARGVCSLREHDDFSAIRGLLLEDQFSPVSRPLGAGQVLEWARSSFEYSRSQSTTSPLDDDRKLVNKIRLILDRRDSAAKSRRATDPRHPTLDPIKANLGQILERCEEYAGPVREAFDNLIGHVILFCRDRLEGSPRERGRRGEYLFRSDANERELQKDLHEYLVGNYLLADIRTEVDGIGTGRADIVVSLGATRFVIELKRYFSTWDRRRIRRFLGQASTYQTGNVRLGMLGILDTGTRVGPPPHLKENLWVERLLPSGAKLPLYIVCFRVPGNLSRPSEVGTPDF